MLGLIALSSCEKEDIEPQNDLQTGVWYYGTDNDPETDAWMWTHNCECQYTWNGGVNGIVDTTDQACIDNIGTSPDCP